MVEIRTVTTLVKKRDEIRAPIRMCEKKIAQARSDLAHVSAVMRLFEASGKPQDLARYVDGATGCSNVASLGPSAPLRSPRGR
jgi:hypothetical protein